MICDMVVFYNASYDAPFMIEVLDYDDVCHCHQYGCAGVYNRQTIGLYLDTETIMLGKSDQRKHEALLRTVSP